MIREKLGGLPCHAFPPLSAGSPHYRPVQSILATDTVRHVGDRVALVVAETLAQAKAAGELVAVDYEPLRAVTLPDALKDGSPKVWEEAGSNISFKLERGNASAVDKQFRKATHVTSLTVVYPRATGNAIEPRSAIAYDDPASGRMTLCTSTQSPYAVRQTLAAVLRMPELALRVIAGDVGGAFGTKSQVYPEEALVLWAAVKLKRPVKWTGERSECLMCDTHGRHQIAKAAMAFEVKGEYLPFARRWTSTSAPTSGFRRAQRRSMPQSVIPGPMTFQYSRGRTRADVHQHIATGPYRGSGKPEATFVMERLIDKAAREMKIDPVALRRRNLIRPSAMPYKTSGGNIYNSGDFERVLDTALRLAGWDGFAKRRIESEKRGLRRGIGLAMHCQRAAANRKEWRFASRRMAVSSSTPGRCQPDRVTRQCSRR